MMWPFGMATGGKWRGRRREMHGQLGVWASLYVFFFGGFRHDDSKV
jgi:uncharacterized iron-regulated membrane protein